MMRWLLPILRFFWDYKTSLIIGLCIGTYISHSYENTILARCNIIATSSGDLILPKIGCSKGGDKELSAVVNGQSYATNVLNIQLPLSQLQHPFAKILNLDSGILRRKICLESYPARFPIVMMIEYQIENSEVSIFDVRNFGVLSEDQKCLFLDSEKTKDVVQDPVLIPIQPALDISTNLAEENCSDLLSLNENLILRSSFVYGIKAWLFSVIIPILFIFGSVNTIISLIEKMVDFKQKFLNS
jgi:hypothetical protein